MCMGLAFGNVLLGNLVPFLRGLMYMMYALLEMNSPEWKFDFQLLQCI